MSPRKEVNYPELGDILSRALGARSQSEMAELCGVSQSIVSQWLSGTRRPRKNLLVSLAYHLPLDPRELAVAALYSPSEILDLYESHLVEGGPAFDDLLESEREKVGWIRQSWIRGNARLAAEHVNLLSQKLRNRLEKYSSPKRRDRILELRSEVLREQVIIVSLCLPRGQAKQTIHLLTKELEVITEALPDNNVVLGSYCFGEASVYYVGGLYSHSKNSYIQALEYLNDDYYLPEVARAVATSSAYLGDRGSFNRAADKVRSIIDGGNLSSSTICHLQEGLAYGQAVLKLPEAIEMVEKADDTLKEAEAKGEGSSAIRRIQISRTNMEAMSSMGSKGNEDTRILEEVGNNAIALCKEYGFGRYVSDIVKELEKALN